MKKNILICISVFLITSMLLCGCSGNDESAENSVSTEIGSLDDRTDTQISSADISDKEPSSTKSHIYQAAEDYVRYGLADSVEKVSESTVSIVVTSNYSGGFYGDYTAEESGSGVIVSDEGYIATNCHVVEEAKAIKIILSSGEEYTAALIGKDSKTDLAVIKIESDEKLVPAAFAESKSLRCGDFVFAIGNALGEYPNSVTMGIISSLSREVIVNGETMTMIQTDAALNVGNSGGGLFDSYGALVGIVAARDSTKESQGIGFAIPSDVAKSVINDIINHGYVTGRPTLGFEATDITSMREAKYYGLDWIGVYISKVEPNSKAETAGLRSKDYIYSVNGEVITTSNRLEEILAETSIGDTLFLEIWRESESIDVVLVVGEDTN